MEQIIITPITFERICRVCLIESDYMFPVHSHLGEENPLDKSPRISDILMSISSMKVYEHDGLPPNICVKCIGCAHNSFKFQKQCNRSQAALDECVAQINQFCVTQTQDDILFIPDELTALAQLNDNELANADFALINHGVTIEDATEVANNDLMLSQSDEIDECINESMEEERNNMLLNLKDDYFSEDDMELVRTSLVVPNDEKIKVKMEIRNDDEDDNEEEDEEDDDDDDEDEERKTKKKSKNGKSMNSYSRLAENGNKVYDCNKCNKTYKFASSLRIHLRNHTHERPYICTICNKSFKQQGSLMYHQRSHSDEQPFACKLCGKRYKQSGTLTAHMRIHTGQRPFLCSICGRGFRQAPDLTYHQRTHTKEKPYMCNVCGKTMSMQSHLVQHMRSHTGERPFKCTECNKAFPSSTRLKRHSIIHTGLKPYTCDVCQKSFNRSSSLRVHSKIHTDERPHVCSVCNKAFIQAHALKSHIVTHSSELVVQKSLEDANDQDPLSDVALV